MTGAERLTDIAGGARDAVDRSADLWLRAAEQLTYRAGLLTTVPAPGVDQVTEQYFEYLQRSLETNRQLAKNWADALSSFADVTASQADSLGDAVRGHSEAIRDWLIAEIDTVQAAAGAQADAYQERRRERVRQQYQDLTKAELADELGKRELPRTGTVDLLVDRLVDADTR